MKKVVLTSLLLITLLISPVLTGCEIGKSAPKVRIAFISDRDGNYEIYVMNADGSAQTRLTNSPDIIEGRPHWYSDGSRLLYGAWNASDDSDFCVYAINPDGSAITPINSDWPENGRNFKASPDISQYAYLLDRGYKSEIHIVEMDGSDDRVIAVADAPTVLLNWSPDGTKLLYATTHETTNFLKLVVIAADGSNTTVITEDYLWAISFGTMGDTDALTPDWSPDSRRILYTTKFGKLHSVKADGSDDVLLIETEGSYGYEWSPDGNKIAVSVRYNDDDNRLIFVIDSDGSNLVQLTDGEYFCDYPVWSPDGSKIAYQAIIDGNSDIFIINVDGTGNRRLTTSPGNDGYPDWSH